MKDYSVKFHTGYLENFYGNQNSRKLVRGKFVGSGNLALTADGLLIRGYYGKYSSTLLEQTAMLAGGIAGLVMAIWLSPVWGNTTESFWYLASLFSLAIILTSVAAYGMIKYLLLHFFYKHALVTIYWEDIDSYCYAYPVSSDKLIGQQSPVLGISHCVDHECNPVMLTSKQADSLVAHLRFQIPEKEKVMRSRRFRTKAKNTGTDLSQIVLDRPRQRVYKGKCIRHCPTCSMKIKLPVSPAGNVGKCTHCNSPFKIHLSGTESMYLTKLYTHSNENKVENYQPAFKEYYDVIGVDVNATPDEVKQAYRKRIREYHPDKVANLGAEIQQVAEKKTRLINEAYDTLKQQGRAN